MLAVAGLRMLCSVCDVLVFVRTLFLKASSLAENTGAEDVSRVAICLVLLHLFVVGNEYITLYPLRSHTFV